MLKLAVDSYEEAEDCPFRFLILAVLEDQDV
jgi:hypothetical protein